MKFEIEPQDIEVIAQRVCEIIKPLVLNQKHDEKDVIFDVPALAGYLHVDSSWIYKAISLKTIPFFKTGRYIRFKKTAIDKWVEGQTVRPVPTLKLVKTRGVTR